MALVVVKAAPFRFIGAKHDHDHAWFELQSQQIEPLTKFDAVIMRTDPPFDLQYLYSTQLLSLAERQGAKVFNSGQAMRDFNEKISHFEFPQIHGTHDRNHLCQWCARISESP